jgi:nicotinamidase-related amidase
VPSLVSEQYVRGLGPTTAAVREAAGAAGAEVMEKLEFSCLRNGAMRETLARRNRPHVILGGIESHVCVLQTALDAIELGLSVFVPEDAVTARTKTNRRAGIRLMERAGASIVTTETIVFAFLERCDAPEFKTMLAEIR